MYTSWLERTITMKTDMKSTVTELLETYGERARKIALLRYELQRLAGVSADEVIDSMSYGHNDGISSGKGYVSNKTLYIALNYQEQVEKLNREAVNEINKQLVELEEIQDKLTHYISLLDDRQKLVIQVLYVEKLSMRECEQRMKISAKTIRKLRNEAVSTLEGMYHFVADRGLN